MRGCTNRAWRNRTRNTSSATRTAQGTILTERISITDLVVRYDEKTGSILFLVPKSPVDPTQLKVFHAFKDIAKVNKAKLAKELGIGFVAFLEATHRSQFPDSSIASDGSPRAKRRSVARTDSRARFRDARLLIDQLGDESSEHDLKTITKVLETARDGGDKRAAEYLEKIWPRLRDVFVRRLSRRK